MMKTTANLNTMTIMINIPLTLIAIIINGDDLIYIFELVMFAMVKSALSAVSSRVRQYLENPNYYENEV